MFQKKSMLSLLLITIFLFSCSAAINVSASETEITDSGRYEYSGLTDPIVIKSGSPTVVLNDVTITAQSSAAITVEAGAELTLILSGSSTLTGGNGYAAICVKPAYDSEWNYSESESAVLNISGDGSLKVIGGNGDQAGGRFGGGAGIGGNGEDQTGGDGVDFGTIRITKDFTGTVDAAGGSAGANEANPDYDNGNIFGGGAGIGSGGMQGGSYDYNWGEVFGKILIENGTVLAQGNGYGAGIGGGGVLGDDTSASKINISISGGKITANGGTCAAGIGGGSMCDGGFISISSGSIIAAAGEADGSLGSAGIGGGDNASVSSVIISGGTVEAIGHGGGAGIGGGSNTTYSYVHYGDTDGARTEACVGKIAISGANTVVKATGGTGIGYSGSYGGAGIGSGYPTANNARSVAFDISVTNGASITAYSGYHAQAIGYGYRPTDYTGYGIKLLLDGSITLWAENADFYQPALALATQYDSAPISYSDDSVYLVRYTDENRDASEATISKALGCLDIASADSISIDFKEILTAAPRGNWATLYRPAPTTGDLTVSKTVSGSGASDAQEFTFTVTLNDDSVNGVYGEMAFENGVSVFKLKAGESKTASDLPAEIAYTVTESDNDGYTVTVNGTDKTEASGTIIAGQTAKAAFNNEKSGEILPTADSSRSLLWGTALLLSCIGIYVAILCKRKQRGSF